MAPTDKEKFVVVLVELTERTFRSKKVWGPFGACDEAQKWIKDNAAGHLDLYGICRGKRLFCITEIVEPMYR